MGVFDAFKNILGGAVGESAGDEPAAGVHQALTEAIEGSSVGGMSGLLAKLHDGGLGAVITSWTSGEAASPLSGDQLRAALGEEHIQGIADKLGVQPDQCVSFLQEHLPALLAAQRTASQ
jgi:uncharacterized protein YidB (DUF937 family)